MDRNAEKVSAADVPTAARPPRYGELAPALSENNYTPVPVALGGKNPLPKDWNRASAEVRATWPYLYPDAQTGILTADLVVFDLDTELAELIACGLQAAGEAFGDGVLERRRDGSNKIALVCSSGAHRYRKGSVVFEHVEETTGEVSEHPFELLGDGQQVVVSGIHPQGGRYRGGSERNVRNTRRDELPVCSPELLDTFVLRLVELAEAAGFRVKRRTGSLSIGNASVLGSSAGDDENPFADLHVHPFTPETHSIEEVRHLLEAQDPAAPHDQWVRTVMALCDWCPERGIDLAIEWSACEKYPDPEDDVRKAWRSLVDSDYRGDRYTLASLIADRKRFDAEQARREEEEREMREAAALNDYRRRIEGVEDEATLIEIRRDACADERLRNAARIRLAEPIRERMKTSGLGARPIKELRRLLTVEGEGDDPTEEGSGDIRARLIRAITAAGDLYVDQHGQALLDLAEDDRVRTLLIGGEAFARHVLAEAMRIGRPVDANAVKMVAANVAVAATLSGSVRQTARRVAQIVGDDPNGGDDVVLVDHGDGYGTMTRISADDVRPPTALELEGVRLLQGDHSAPLPPVEAIDRDELLAAVDQLWRFVPVAEGHRTLLLAAMLDCLRPAGDQPILVLTGPAGSGKSTALEFVRSLIDPQSCGLAGKPRNQRDAAACLAANYVTAIDNPTNFKGETEDLFARAATGGADVAATLFANSGSTARDIGGPIMLAAIEQPFRQADVLSRCVVVPIAGQGERRDKNVVRKGFEAARPMLLSALYGLLAVCMRELPTTEVRGVHRFVGFERLGEALQRVLGVEGAFADVLAAEARAARLDALETFPVLLELVEMMVREHAAEPLRTTVRALLRRLGMRAKRGPVRRTDEWPATPQVFGMLIRRQREALHDAGVTVEEVGQRNGVAQILLTANERAPSPADLGGGVEDAFPELDEVDAPSEVRVSRVH